MTDQLFDPYLGKERDAFPGEVVSPAEESTLQRLMREGKEEFGRIYESVRQTGKLTEDELNALLKAGEVNAEIKRQEYLEAIRSNPASILQRVLIEANALGTVNGRFCLQNIDESVKRVIRSVDSSISASSVANAPQSTTEEYIERALGKGNISARFTALIVKEPDDYSIAVSAIDRLKLIPGEVTDLFDLRATVSNANNAPASNLPYYNANINTVFGLRPKLPGLEGVTVSIKYQGQSVDRVFFEANAEALAKVYDLGQYTPYQELQSKP